MDTTEALKRLAQGELDVGYHEGEQRDLIVPDEVGIDGESIKVSELTPIEAYALGYLTHKGQSEGNAEYTLE